MSRYRPVLRPVLVASSLALALSLAGCGAGQSAQSVKPYAPGDGEMADSGHIRVLNALVVVANGVDRGVVSMTIANRGDRDDQLTGLTSPDGTVDLTGSRTVAGGQAVRFGAATEPAATISDLTKAPGQIITLRLAFQHTEPITLRTVIVPATGDFADLTPGPETPAELPTPTEISGTPSPLPTESSSG